MNILFFSQYEVEVVTEKVANYRKYMPVKIPEDTSSVVRSPMPGL